MDTGARSCVAYRTEDMLVIYVRTFKGYEDKVRDIDNAVNEWIHANQVEAVDVKTVMSHEAGSRAGSGDLIYTVLYRAEHPLPD